MSMTYTRAALARAVAPAEGDGPKIYTFLATSDALDRQGEVVTVEGWQLDAYRRNPVIVDSHDYSSIEHIIGRALAVRETDAGLEADVQFNDTPKGRLAAQLVEGGDLRGVSVGFRPIEMAVPRDAREPVQHTRKELLEISAVAVPANPDALRLRGMGDDAAVKAGRTLSAKNESKLREAAALIGAVLASLTPADGADEGRAAEVGALDVDLAALKAFVEGN